MFFAPARIAGARLVTFGRDHMSASDLKQKSTDQGGPAVSSEPPNPPPANPKNIAKMTI